MHPHPPTPPQKKKKKKKRKEKKKEKRKNRYAKDGFSKELRFTWLFTGYICFQAPA